MNNLSKVNAVAVVETSPWLSILIPVYNVEAYLTECLDSVMYQIADGVEVILLDDCSTDGSFELMQSLEKRWAGRLILLQHAQNSGLSAARNSMMTVAQGEYLWFLDSDDKLLPGAIQNLSDIVRTNAPDIVLCNFKVWREFPKLKHRLRGEFNKTTFAGTSRQLLRNPAQLLTGLLRTGELHAWSKISRRSIWQSGIQFPAGRYFEDMLPMLLVAADAGSFYYEPRPWVAYRQRSSSILGAMNLQKAGDQSAALLSLKTKLDARVWARELAFEFALAHQCARNFTGAMRYLTNQGEDALSGAEMNALAARFRADFETASPFSADALKKAYLRRGWWLKWLRFHRLFQRKWG